MKIKKSAIVVAAIGILVASVGVWAGTGAYFNGYTPQFVPMTMPYQGIMEKNGELYTGQMDFKVSLCDYAEGDCYWGPEVHEEVQVQDGSFSLIIGDEEALDEEDNTILLSHTDIDKVQVYLRIQIRGQNDVAYLDMGARQKLHSSPYAIRSFRAEIAENGTVANGGSFAIKNENTDKELWRVDDSGKMTLGDKFTFIPSTDDWLRFQKKDLSGYADMAMNKMYIYDRIMFQNHHREKLTLYNDQKKYAIGTQEDTLYSRTEENFAWYELGEHNGNELDPGSGTTLMELNSSRLKVNGNIELTGNIMGDFGLEGTLDSLDLGGGGLSVEGHADINSLSVNAGDLSVSGDITTSGGGGLVVDGDISTANGHIRNVSWHTCSSGHCGTPRQCLNLCQSENKRMATVGDVIGRIARGADYEWCHSALMIDEATQNPIRGIPMYSHRSGCGTSGTENTPRLESKSGQYGWNSTVNTDYTTGCACATIL